MKDASTLRKVCRMAGAPSLQPTLWRTCRVLANRTRLKMLNFLTQQEGQQVSAVAARLKLPVSLASEYLRAMEARGLLAVRRTGRCVEYRLPTATGESVPQRLVSALRLSFKQQNQPIETLFKLATAFTHPRRIDIFRALQKQHGTIRQLKSCTAISDRALLRHLNKLKARGFVVCRSGVYSTATRRDAFGRELARLAAGF